MEVQQRILHIPLELYTQYMFAIGKPYKSQLIFGTPIGNGRLEIANMTLTPPDGLQLISLEEFDSLTTAINCEENDETISLTFKSRKVFKYALETWKYINEHEESNFVAIANHVGCGTEDKRQPYLVTRVTEDVTKLTIYLTSQKVPWSKIAQTYTVDVGKAIISSVASQIRSRGWWKDHSERAKQKLAEWRNHLTGWWKDRGDLHKDFQEQVNMNIGNPSEKHELWNDNTHLKLVCTECYMQGALDINAHIKVEDCEVKELTLKGDPRGLKAAFVLEAEMTRVEKPVSLGKQFKNGDIFDTRIEKSLLEVEIPDIGLVLPEVFKIGVWATWDIGAQISFQGSTTIGFGLKMEVPDDVNFLINVGEPKKSTGHWPDGAFDTVFDVKKFSGQVSMAVFMQTKLNFGIEVDQIGKFDIALGFKTPQAQLKLIGGFDEVGFCEQEFGALQTGVKAVPEVGVQLGLQIDKYVGKVKGGKPWYWMTLWKKFWPLAEPLCYALPIGDLNASKPKENDLDPMQSQTLIDPDDPGPDYSYKEGDTLMDLLHNIDDK